MLRHTNRLIVSPYQESGGGFMNRPFPPSSFLDVLTSSLFGKALYYVL